MTSRAPITIALAPNYQNFRRVTTVPSWKVRIRPNLAGWLGSEERLRSDGVRDADHVKSALQNLLSIYSIDFFEIVVTDQWPASEQ